jgi:hypothetical protein
MALIGFGLIAAGWLFCRFVLNYRPPSGPLQLAWIVIGLGSVFSILPALFLLSRRYGVANLGLRLQGIATTLPVLAIFAGLTFASATQHHVVRRREATL